MIQKSHLPKSIILHKWQEQEFSWQGLVSNQDFPRIASIGMLQEGVLSCRLIKKEALLFKFEVKIKLEVECQRCLSLMAYQLHLAESIALIKSQDEAATLIETEHLLLSDALCDDKLPIGRIIEDSLLLALPLAPKHEQCTPIKMQAGPDLDDIQACENPFAALYILKSQKMQ